MTVNLLKHMKHTHARVGCQALQTLAVCVQGRTDSGHLYVMDPTDILSTGGRGFGLSPLPSGANETGVAGAALQHPKGSTHLRTPFMLAIGRLQLYSFHMNEYHAGASCFCLGGGATCCDLDWEGFKDI